MEVRAIPATDAMTTCRVMKGQAGTNSEMEELERSTTAGEAMHARKAQRACVRAPTLSGIPVAKSTGKPDRRYSTDGRHGATGDENAQAPASLIPEMIQVMRRSARISKTVAPLQGQHTNADADSGSSTPPERIGLHGGTPNKAGAANNHATRQSTATGCVATDTHCVSLKGAALQGTPSSQPTSVTTPNNPKPGQQQDLSTPSAATVASTSPAIIDDVLATKTPSPQDLLKDATEKTTNIRPHSLTRFPRIIASNADATTGEAGCRPAASEPISLSGGAPAPAKNFSNSTTSGESAQA